MPAYDARKDDQQRGENSQVPPKLPDVHEIRASTRDPRSIVIVTKIGREEVVLGADAIGGVPSQHQPIHDRITAIVVVRKVLRQERADAKRANVAMAGRARSPASVPSDRFHHVPPRKRAAKRPAPNARFEGHPMSFASQPCKLKLVPGDIQRRPKLTPPKRVHHQEHEAASMRRATASARVDRVGDVAAVANARLAVSVVRNSLTSLW